MGHHYGMSDDEWEDNISKNLDFDQYSHENSITYEENNSKEDGEKSDYDWEDYFANEENRNDLINKPYIQGIIKAEVEKQLKELLKDKISSRKYIPHTAAEVDVERVIWGRVISRADQKSQFTTV